MILANGEAQYRVGDRVAETVAYRIYLCEEMATNRQYLLQIATETTNNGGLDRAAYVLRELKKTADLFEAEYAKRGSGRKLSYDRLFPQVVDSFVSEVQGNRRINILAIAEVDDVTRLVPLSNLATRDGLRVSLVSSAWIMGRLLKLLAFAHDEGIAVRALSGNNILLEPSRHFALVFDWSMAQTYSDTVPVDVRKDDIANVAKAVFVAIGGDVRNGSYPYNGSEDPRYVQMLWRLACRRESNADKAHEQFYELVEELWGRVFRPFETLPL